MGDRVGVQEQQDVGLGAGRRRVAVGAAAPVGLAAHAGDPQPVGVAFDDRGQRDGRTVVADDDLELLRREGLPGQ
ncbi:hypothetical protein TPA0907_36220 [Micromonospora humidisoli]|nr:hypothetical protein TPA0907_36220 [Micromonospora sp. AKA109]